MKYFPAFILLVSTLAVSAVESLPVADSLPLPSRTLFIQQGEEAWMGTRDGLYRYQSDNELVSVVRSGPVTDLLLDENILWTGTPSGLYYAGIQYLDWKRFGFVEGLASDTVVRLAADADYVYAAAPHGLAQYDKLVGQWELLRDFSGNRIYDIYSDVDNLWLATGKGVERYYKAFRKWEHCDDKAAYRLFPFKNAIWALTSSGFARYNEGMKNWTHYGRTDGLPDTPYTALLSDNASIWAVSASGVYRFKGEEEVWEHFSRNTPLENLPVSDIALSGAQSYFTTSKGVYTYQEAERKWTLYTIAEGLAGNTQQSIFSTGRIALCRRGDAFSIFRASDNLWFTRQATDRGGKVGAQGWKGFCDDRGAGFQAPDGRNLSLLGRAYFKVRNRIDFQAPVYDNILKYMKDGRPDTLSGFNRFMYWWEKAQLNLNGGMKDGRNMLGAFDNTDPRGELKYGLEFRGNSDDPLRRAGVQSAERPDYFFGSLVPSAVMEGAVLRTQAGGRVGPKKRSRSNFSAYAGQLKTRFLSRRITYQDDNFYFLGVSNIVTESVELRVDGQVIDPSEYSIERTMGILTFRDEARANPDSRIEISLEYQPSLESVVGDLVAAEEMVAISPNLSVSAAGLYLGRGEPDRAGTRQDDNRLFVGSAAAEAEYASTDGKNYLRVRPEISGSSNDSILYEKQGSAARLEVNAAVDRLRVQAEGALATDNYDNAGGLRSPYGRVSREGDVRAVYDVLPWMPVTAAFRGLDAQQGRSGSGSLEWLASRSGWPSLKLRSQRDQDRTLAAYTGADSTTALRWTHRLETVWDAPASAVQALHLNRLGLSASYELDDIDLDSLGQSETRMNHHVYGRLQVTPVRRLLLETKTYYRYLQQQEAGAWVTAGSRFRPEFMLFSQELIPGITLYGRLRQTFGETGTSNDTLRTLEERRFNGSVLVAPGVYWAPLNPFQLNTGYSRMDRDSSARTPLDSTLARISETAQTYTLNPAFYFGQDIRFLNREELSLSHRMSSLRSKGLKVYNDLDLYFRNRKTNLLFEYDYTRDSSMSDTLSRFTSGIAHEARARWTERWLSEFRTEFRLAASRSYSDTAIKPVRDGFATGVLLDYRSSRFVRELRIQEFAGPSFSNGNAFDFQSYDPSFDSKTDISLKAGRNLFARLLINLSYSFTNRIFKYDMAEFKLTAVF
ncbi:MAG: hypothetical protein V1913_17525 [Fibrobacterota bacterium]